MTLNIPVETDAPKPAHRQRIDRLDIPPRTKAILVQELYKAYKGVRAVNGISFDVEQGEIFAVLGPNGAGKTTTVEILEGYRRADNGHIRVLGLDPTREGRALRPSIGVMLQQDGLQPGLSPRELLTLYGHFYLDPLPVEELLQRLHLESAKNTHCRRLSGGQRRRLALGLALIGRPRLLFLDEPTTGMDPEGRLATWDSIRTLRDEGTTILFTTHLLDEAERLADRVAIIDHGRLIALDSPRALTRGSATTVRLVVPDKITPEPFQALPSVRSLHEEAPGRYVFHTEDPAVLMAEIAARLRDQHIVLDELRVGNGSLEETYLRLTRETPGTGDVSIVPLVTDEETL